MGQAWGRPSQSQSQQENYISNDIHRFKNNGSQQGKRQFLQNYFQAILFLIRFNKSLRIVKDFLPFVTFLVSSVGPIYLILIRNTSL